MKKTNNPTAEGNDMSEHRDAKKKNRDGKMNQIGKTAVIVKKSPFLIMIYLVIGVCLIFIDQFTKYLAAYFLKNGTDIVLISDVFELHYLENQSAAFGVDPVSLLQKVFSFSYFTEHPEALLTCKMVFLVLLTIIVLALLFYLFLRIPTGKHFLPVNLTLIFFMAGAIGNCIDRVLHQYVIDFFYFQLIDFPVFNVADIYVTVSTAFLIVLAFFFYKEEDFELIFPSKGKKDEETHNSADSTMENSNELMTENSDDTMIGNPDDTMAENPGNAIMEESEYDA